MTRFIRRATIAAALIAAPMFALSAPAAAAGAAQPAAASVAGAKSAAGSTPSTHQGSKKKRPRSRPAPTAPARPAASPTTPAPAQPAVTPDDFEAQVVTLTNAQRVAAGCGALRTDDRLVLAARMHSSDMVARKFFSHTGSNGSDFVARESQHGYTGASAENIAWGYRTPQEVVTGWMTSPGHRANILDCGSVAVGVGLALAADGTPYWTQDFGRI